jgi:hypothetical protein
MAAGPVGGRRAEFRVLGPHQVCPLRLRPGRRRRVITHLARLRIDLEVFGWIVRALPESCSDEKREHQTEWDRLQTRIEAM